VYVLDHRTVVDQQYSTQISRRDIFHPSPPISETTSSFTPPTYFNTFLKRYKHLFSFELNLCETNGAFISQSPSMSDVNSVKQSVQNKHCRLRYPTRHRGQMTKTTHFCRNCHSICSATEDVSK